MKTITAYSYKELEAAALNTHSQEDIKALAEWFENFSDYKFWNGECHKVNDQYSLYPIYKQNGEDEFEIVGWELR